jgi:2-polyprenyl-6-methoxyphenol hydroxylase-like FAD-dependent oxidoreductase
MQEPLRAIRPAVLIVGAGPTGLLLAFTLARQGVPIRLIDRHPGPSVESRAMGVQARTLEFYRMMGLAEDAVALGTRTGDAHVWVEGKERAGFSLDRMGEGISPYPFLLTLAQDVHERFLIQRLARIDVVPEWNTELVGLHQSASEVTATLRLAGGGEERLTAVWLVGCDGAGSFVRQALGIGFGGGTSEGNFFVADVEISEPNSDVHVGIGPDTLSLMMPVRTSGTQRLIGIVPPDVARRGDVTSNDIVPGAADLVGVTVRDVNWFSTYKVHHRVADSFRVGRCFIAGDAGHIHSPVGGQGMNTGLGDAMNLGWKLGHVVRGAASPALLDTYQPERITFARSLIASTDAAFQKIVSTGWMARQLRLRIIPLLVRTLTRYAFSGRKMFETVSQVRIGYRDSALSDGRAGGIRAGDRLPWVAAYDTHVVFDGRSWTAHASGRLDTATAAALKETGIALHIWPDEAAMRRAGYRAGALYLVRPDGHVGLADASPSAERVLGYLSRNGLSPAKATLDEVRS